MTRYSETIRQFLIGMVMGAAEVVPGVSGGTIAFVSGIYERLVNAIRRFTPYVLLRLKNEGLVATWHYLDSNFLLTLVLGMGTSIVLFASGLSYMLTHQPVIIWSFFFGLVLSSAAIVARDVGAYTPAVLVMFAAGVAVGMFVTQVVPLQLEPSPVTLFIGGAIAICAWILPGLSGSFILLILGLYLFVIDAIKSFDLLSIASLGAGCALGIVSFAQLVSYLFQRHRDVTLALLTGFMVGSLTKLWPWKQTTSYQLKPDGSQVPLIQEPVFPAVYTDLTGTDPQIMIAVLSALTGIALVFLLNWVAGKNRGVSGEQGA